MLRQFLLALGIIALIFSANWPYSPAVAQGENQARTHYAVTVYSAPDRANPIVGILAPQAKIILEGRNADASWVLTRSTDGAVRGWIEIRLVDLTETDSIASLLVSNEVIFTSANAPSTGDYEKIDLYNYPILPIVTEHAREIFEIGRIRGMDPHVISKIGDCISDNGHFLSPFGWDQYDLGTNKQLQSVINQFSSSLASDSHAAYDGLVTTAVIDPLFANPLACRPGESPLRCEYRVHKPSVAIIMFGAQDLLFTSPDAFEYSLRRIIHETIQSGVIPILSTFPNNLQQQDRDFRYNQIVVQVALDYDIPLLNLWLALEDLPNHGLDDDGRHLSVPLTNAGDLTQPNLQQGYTLRNLVTLQALDIVWHGAMN